MDVSFLIKEYFRGVEDNISIDVFDSQTLNSVYSNVVQVLTSHFEIETSVLQSLSYCFYEILDNVHIHSGKPLGTAITYYNAENAVLRVLVADDGMGILASLDLDPNDVVDHRTDIESEYNDPFLVTDELDSLW